MYRAWKLELELSRVILLINYSKESLRTLAEAFSSSVWWSCGPTKTVFSRPRGVNIQVAQNGFQRGAEVCPTWAAHHVGPTSVCSGSPPGLPRGTHKGPTWSAQKGPPRGPHRGPRRATHMRSPRETQFVWGQFLISLRCGVLKSMQNWSCRTFPVAYILIDQ